MQPTELPQDELDDALEVIKSCGFSSDEFSFDAVQNIPGAGPIRVVVTVTRKGHASIAYEAGHGTAWLPQFSDSLKSGAFGAAPKR